MDLDNVGDPGLWLESELPDVLEVLEGDQSDIQEAAGLLAEAYIAAATAMEFPLPSDFGMAEEECREVLEAEFQGFLQEWSRRFRSVA